MLALRVRARACTLRRGFHLALNAGVMAAARITPIPMFADNYAWRVDNEVHGTSVLVDPADAAACLATYARDADAPELVAVLTTHFHNDHAGGNADIAAARPGIAIVGGEGEHGRVPAATRLVRDGDRVEAGHMTFDVLETPCHTRGHVSYLLRTAGAPPAVFTGDTLFAAGCGRFFEGDAAAMAASLAKLAALPGDTRVYCGHEYTVDNLQFCLHVEPDNAATRARMDAALQARRAGRPTVPSTIAEELATNVFLRCREPGVQAFTHGSGGAPDPVEVLARLRTAKNAFKPARLE